MLNPTDGKCKLSDIHIGDRGRKDYGSLNSLVLSIRELGLIHPISVVEKKSGKHKYQLVAGGRRLEACKVVPLDEVPIRIYDTGTKKSDQLAIELYENLERRELSWREEIDMKADLAEAKYGKKQKEIAEEIGDTESGFSQDVSLSKALASVPEIADVAKTKDEARKMLSMVNEKMIENEIKKRVKEEQAKTPVDKTRKQLVEAYHVGDVFKYFKTVQTELADLVEIDPPFAIDLKESKYTTKGAEHPLSSVAEYEEIEYNKYEAFMQGVLAEAFRILKPDSWLIVWYGIHPWHKRMAEMIVEAKFEMMPIPGVWYKRTGQTKHPKVYMGNAYETFFYARKGKGACLNKEGRSNVFDYRPIAAQLKTHPTAKPIEMYEDLYATFVPPSNTIIIPFLGSGNGILAAYNYGCKAFGTDLVETYRDKYIVEVFGANPGEYTSYRSEK